MVPRLLLGATACAVDPVVAEDDGGSTNHTGWGVFLAVLCTLQSCAAHQLVRFSSVAKEAQKETAWSRIAGILGIVLNVAVGPLLDLASFGLAKQSVVAPIGGLGIVWNVLLAPITLGEQMTNSRILGCLLVFAGIVGTGVFGNHYDPAYSLDDYADRFLSLSAIVFFMVILAIIVAACIGKNSETQLTRGISLAALGGCGGGNMYFLKVTSSSVIEVIGGDMDAVTMFTHPLFYVCVLGTVAAAVCAARYLHEGLAACEAMFMTTMFEGLMLTTASLSGVFVLGDMECLPSSQVALYMGALFLCMLGLLTLYSGEPKMEEDRPGVTQTDPDDSGAELRPLERKLSRGKSAPASLLLYKERHSLLAEIAALRNEEHRRMVTHIQLRSSQTTET